MLRLAEQQHAVVTRAQAHTVGASNKVLRTAVRSGRLKLAGRDVFRVPGYPSTFEQQLLIAVFGCDNEGRCAASRRSAAALHGLDGFRDDVIEITTSEHRRDFRPAQTSIHSTSLWLPEDIVSVRGVPTTDIIRTIIDLAGAIPPKRLTRVLDAAERDLLVDRNALEDRLDRIRQRGRNGVGVLARELDGRSRPGANPTTALERNFCDLLSRFSIAPPDCQVKVLLRGGSVAIVDFAWLDLMLIVETDGHRAHATREQRAKDAVLRAKLQRRGFEVIVFTWEQVQFGPLDVLRDLRAAMHDRAEQVRDGRITLDLARIASWRRGDIV